MPQEIAKSKKSNGKPEAPDLPRGRGASGYVAVNVKTETYRKLCDALPEHQRRACERAGMAVRLNPGSLLDWLVREYLK